MFLSRSSKTLSRILISSRVFRGTPESRLGFLLELEFIRGWWGTFYSPELLPESGSWNSRASDKKFTLSFNSLIWVRSWLTIFGSHSCCIECSSKLCWVKFVLFLVAASSWLFNILTTSSVAFLIESIFQFQFTTQANPFSLSLICPFTCLSQL